MKLIFLDIDGVLNTCYTKERTSTYKGLEEKHIRMVEKMLRERK